MILAPWDELNSLREKLNGWRADWNPLKKPDKRLVRDCIDEVVDLLIMAYVYGKNNACDCLDHKVPADPDKMRETIWKEIAGETFEQRVERHMENFDVEAIINVADTEMTRDYNEAGLNTAGLIGKETKRSVMKTWNTMADDRVRDTHDYLHGSSTELEKAFFTYDGDSAMAPGGFTLPENNCGCRCWLTFSYG